jgi:transketolase
MSTHGSESCRHAFTRTLTDLARKNSEIYVVTSDARGSVTLNGFADELPAQFVETGIAEQNATGISAGLALSGKTVFLCGPACFYSARSVEQIKNDIAYSGANVKIVGVSGGVSYGALGSTHHSLHDIALFRAIPDISIHLPADNSETESLTKMLAATTGPAYMRLGRGAVPDVYDELDVPFSAESIRILQRGDDCTILATGETVYPARQAGRRLSSMGVSSTVAVVHTIKPMDRDGILSICADKKLVVTVEEHSIYGGLGGATAELLATNNPVPMRIMGFPDEFLPAGSSAELFEYAGITVDSIVDGVQEALRCRKTT